MLAELTGGVKIIWTKTLKGVAGAAPLKLLNVIAHEFCHLATGMISKKLTARHTKVFWEWARKCEAAFAHRGVRVTTSVSWPISYKYTWKCSNQQCGHEYERHWEKFSNAHTCCLCLK